MNRPITPPPTSPIAMRLRDAAAACGISERRLWQLVRSGDLRASRSGRTWLVQPDAIREWLASNEQRGGAAAS